MENGTIKADRPNTVVTQSMSQTEGDTVSCEFIMRERERVAINNSM